MVANSSLLKIRAKKLGLILIDARNNAKQTIKDCSSAMGISVARMKSYESGALSPTLPELEAYAFFLDLPISHFLGEKLLAEEDANSPTTIQQFIEIRQRVIGTALRMARNEFGQTFKQLSEKTLISPAKLKKYESGETPIPIPELEQLSRALIVPIDKLLAQGGKVGTWRKKMLRSAQLSELPEELQDFVCHQVNQPFLELAKKLSALPADKLRAVAEGLLEITY
jgi:transcriptional regulator with XRE-family HTH domain